MKKRKSHLWYNNSQRNGIFFLVLFIVILQLFYFFALPKILLNSNNETIEGDKAKMVVFQYKIDSLKQLALEKRKPKIYPFNPSFLTDYKGYQLGMSTVEIDRLIQHRAKGKYINSAKEFQLVTNISDSLLKTIQPYFKFPDWVLKKQLKKTSRHFSQNIQSKNHFEKPLHKVIQTNDLNKVTAQELRTIYGVGEKLSNRIVNYRNKLGGYTLKEQLYEVWYLDKEIADKILEKFTIIEKPIIKKLNVNTATFKEILSIAYIDYNLTKKIINYREEVGEIQTLDELVKIKGFPIKKLNRIALYLEAK